MVGAHWLQGTATRPIEESLFLREPFWDAFKRNLKGNLVWGVGRWPCAKTTHRSTPLGQSEALGGDVAEEQPRHRDLHGRRFVHRLRHRGLRLQSWVLCCTPQAPRQLECLQQAAGGYLMVLEWWLLGCHNPRHGNTGIPM